MACERQGQVVDLARMVKLELDHTLDRVTACMNSWEAGFREARMGNVAATLSPSFEKAVRKKRQVYRHGATKQVAKVSPASSEHGGSEVGDADDQSVARSDGSTAVSHLDKSWTYINSPRSEQSSYVWLPSQASSVADKRVNANIEFSSPLTAFSAEESSSSLTYMQDVGTWLPDMCATDARTLLLRQPQTSGEGQMSTEIGDGLESDLEVLLHSGGLQLSGLANDRLWVAGTGKMYPGWNGVESITEVNGAFELTGGCHLLPYRGEAPWTHLSPVSA